MSPLRELQKISSSRTNDASMAYKFRRKEAKSKAKEKYLAAFSTNDEKESLCVTAPFDHVHSVVQFLNACCDRRPILAAPSQRPT
jgi:hypothetical protein